MTSSPRASGAVAPLIAIAAGLALADASVVTLALPDLLVQLDTTVEGVAAVIGVYTFVLAATLIPAERLMRSEGAARVGAAGFVLFAVMCLVCGAAGSLPLLLVARALQAVGGGASLVAAFALLHGERGSARNLWLGAAVLSAAIGPAFGGLMTEALSWRWIFFAQVPFALIAAGLAWRADPRGTLGVVAVDAPAPAAHRSPIEPWRAGAALALVSAALTAVLFLLVLLLVAGWAIAPLAAAAAVTVLPLSALAGSRLTGDPRWRAAGGCLLVGLGTIALAWLPNASVAWTIAPQVLAGLGMGLALPALGGELLPERDAGDAARLLTVRHVGIALALIVVTPIASSKLTTATHDAQLQGVAVVLDAKLDPTEKISLAPALLASVDKSSPRQGLRDAVDEQRSNVSSDQVGAYDTMAARADDVLVNAVRDAFFWAFVITGAFALLGAALLLVRVPPPAWLPVAAVLGAAVVGVQIAEQHAKKPDAVTLADPCKSRALPSTGGLLGGLQDAGLKALDRSACNEGSSREELVLALADPGEAKKYEKKYGTDPRSAGGLLNLLLGG